MQILQNVSKAAEYFAQLWTPPVMHAVPGTQRKYKGEKCYFSWAKLEP